MSSPKAFKLVVRGSSRTGKVINLTVSAFEEHVLNHSGFRLSFNRKDDGTPLDITVVQTIKEGQWAEVKVASIKELAIPLQSELAKHEGHLNVFKATGILFINLDEIGEDIGNQYSASLEDIVNSPNPRISESQFRVQYLPFFTLRPDEINDPDYPEKYSAAIRRWKLEVAGMSNDVDVIDGTGTLVFVVPSISMRASVQFTGKSSIHTIHEEFEYIRELDPEKSDRYLEQELSNALSIDELERKDALNSTIQMINRIRLYYGRGPLFEEVSNKNTTSVTVSQKSGDLSDDDFIDFDD